MFVYHPSKQLSDSILHFFNTTDKLTSFKCPDQDFLTTFFENRWISLPWQYNARKTMRYRHPNIWRDNEVICLHYIVDKPWAARVGEDGIAGYKGEDGMTHSWWWDEYLQWERSRESQGMTKTLNTVRKYVAREDDGELSDEDMLAIGSHVQKLTHSAFSDDAEGEESDALIEVGPLMEVSGVSEMVPGRL